MFKKKVSTPPIITSKKCGHNTCHLHSASDCCACGDKRPLAFGYEKYVDGRGYTKTATREEYYCPACKEREASKRWSHPLPVTTKNNPSVTSSNISSSSSSSSKPSSSRSPSKPVVIPFCPHSDVQTDCRICGSETIEQTATKTCVKMGFNLSQIQKAIKKLKNESTISYKTADALSQALVDILLADPLPSDSHDQPSIPVPSNPFINSVPTVHHPSAPPMESSHSSNNTLNPFYNAPSNSSNHQYPSYPIAYPTNPFNMQYYPPPPPSPYFNNYQYPSPPPPHPNQYNYHFSPSTTQTTPFPSFPSQPVQSQQPSTKSTSPFEDEFSCKICFEASANAVLIPCGHLALCFSCAKTVASSNSPLCPICRQKITNVVQTFRA